MPFIGFNLLILWALCSQYYAKINLDCYRGLFKHKMPIEWLFDIPIIFYDVGCSVFVQEPISYSLGVL